MASCDAQYGSHQGVYSRYEPLSHRWSLEEVGADSSLLGKASARRDPSCQLGLIWTSGSRIWACISSHITRYSWSHARRITRPGYFKLSWPSLSMQGWSCTMQLGERPMGAWWDSQALVGFPASQKTYTSAVWKLDSCQSASLSVFFFFFLIASSVRLDFCQLVNANRLKIF